MGLVFTPFVLWALGFGLLFAVLNWIAILRRNKPLATVAKPATLVAFIVAGAALADLVGWRGVAPWFVPALVFSLLGDIFLMLPGARWFLSGLLAFLLAHFAYIGGFTATLPPLTSVLSSAVLLPVVGALDWVVLRRLSGGVARSETPTMRAPVIAYGIVLSLTLFSGWSTWFRTSWEWQAQAAAALGATLFFASDLMLAWDRFVRKSWVLHIAVMVTYHLAQLLLTITIGLAP